MNKIQKWFLKTDIPYSIIAEEIDVSVKTLYNWQHKIKFGKKLSYKADQALKQFYIRKKIGVEEEMSTAEKDQTNTNDLIDLQRDKIKIQKNQIRQLTELLNDNPLQNKQWSDIDADFCTDVEVKINAFKPTSRRITNMRGMESIKNALNISDEEEKRIWCEDEWYDFEYHPCNDIIEKESLKMIQKETKTMPSLLESLRLFIGNYYMAIPVIYEHNGQKVVTHSYLKIGWKIRPVTIFTKNVIIKDV
mgnify:CR=1 FL=1